MQSVRYSNELPEDGRPTGHTGRVIVIMFPSEYVAVWLGMLMSVRNLCKWEWPPYKVVRPAWYGTGDEPVLHGLRMVKMGVEHMRHCKVARRNLGAGVGIGPNKFVVLGFIPNITIRVVVVVVVLGSKRGRAGTGSYLGKAAGKEREKTPLRATIIVKPSSSCPGIGQASRNGQRPQVDSSSSGVLVEVGASWPR